MIILNGVKYRLTMRGKIAIGILAAIMILLIMIAFGSKPDTKKTTASLPQTNIVTTSDVTPKSNVTQPEKVVTTKMPVPKSFSIFFGPDSTSMDNQYTSKLDQIAEYLKATTGSVVVVEGNYNAYPYLKGAYFEGLALDRAMNVAGYLKLRDVPEGQIKVVNLGGKKQLNKGTSKVELAKNRRVDVSVSN